MGLSKYGSEEEVILSGIARFSTYQLTFYADALEEEGDKNAKDYTIQVTQSMIFIRRGHRAFYGDEHRSAEKSHQFVQTAMDGKVLK